MQTEIQRRDIFECNIPPCNTIPRSEQFKIWEDGFRVGYINGTDDVENKLKEVIYGFPKRGVVNE